MLGGDELAMMILALSPSDVLEGRQVAKTGATARTRGCGRPRQTDAESPAKRRRAPAMIALACCARVRACVLACACGRAGGGGARATERNEPGLPFVRPFGGTAPLSWQGVSCAVVTALLIRGIP